MSDFERRRVEDRVRELIKALEGRWNKSLLDELERLLKQLGVDF